MENSLKKRKKGVVFVLTFQLLVKSLTQKGTRFLIMVKYVLFSDPLRQEEIETFYTACQMQRNYYRGYPHSKHPLKLFIEPEYKWQCPSDMTQVYITYPAFHVKYKQPVTSPLTLERTSEMPTLPERTLAGRFNKGACKRYIR